MRIVFSVVLLTAALFLPTAVSAQELKVYPLETNFSGQGTVIELDFPDDADGVPFYIFWQTAGGQHIALSHARSGRHCYEMRHRDEWQGQVAAVAITTPGVPGRLKKPTFADDIDMFFETEAIAPSTVNFVAGHTLFGWPSNTFLVIIVLLSALWFAKFKRIPVERSLALGFLLAWGTMILRNAYDHAAIVYEMEAHKTGMFPVTTLNVFADHASEVIGNESWGDDLNGIFGSFLHYRLAQQPYASGKSDRRPAFWITRNPADGQVVWEYANYYLLKKNQR